MKKVRRENKIHSDGLIDGPRRRHPRKTFNIRYLEKRMAERVGFEPTNGCPYGAFRVRSFDHSAISPSKNEMVPHGVV